MSVIPNHNEDYGIFYGIVSARNLDDDLVHFLLYENSNMIDHSYNRALVELMKEFNVFTLPNGEFYIDDGNGDNLLPGKTFMTSSEAIEHCAGGYRALENIQIDEPVVEGEHEGTKYITSWLGGALHFFITQSSAYTEEAPACSPCVPNAGDIDSWIEGRQGNQTAFLPPLSWLSTEAHAAVTKEWRDVRGC